MSSSLLGLVVAGKRRALPYFSTTVAAGFPSPAQDFVEKRLDLNELCINHPAATYFVRAMGDSMIGSGIFSGDTLIVDRSLEACHGNIVIAAINGEFTVKRLQLRPHVALLAENPTFPAIYPEELDIFGIVTFVLHPLR